MKLTCCQCSRVIFSAPRFNHGKTFCDNDFCLEEFRKVQKGMYRLAKLDFPAFNATYPPSATGWGAPGLRPRCEISAP
jgi:hypothetical protein